MLKCWFKLLEQEGGAGDYIITFLEDVDDEDVDDAPTKVVQLELKEIPLANRTLEGFTAYGKALGAYGKAIGLYCEIASAFKGVSNVVFHTLSSGMTQQYLQIPIDRISCYSEDISGIADLIDPAGH